MDFGALIHRSLKAAEHVNRIVKKANGTLAFISASSSQITLSLSPTKRDCGGSRFQLTTREVEAGSIEVLERELDCYLKRKNVQGCGDKAGSRTR